MLERKLNLKPKERGNLLKFTIFTLIQGLNLLEIQQYLHEFADH